MPGRERYFIVTTQDDAHKVAGKPVPTTLQFIASNGLTPAGHDKASREIIRTQATRQTAEARKNEFNKKKNDRNLRKSPIFNVVGSKRTRSGGLPSPNPLRPSIKGYELVRARYGIDIATLSMLTTFHVGRATVNALSSNPLRLREMLRQTGSSYFSYLPKRFDEGPFLQDAFECVVARVRGVLTPDSCIRPERILHLYSKALKSLQVALNCPRKQHQPELLCAISVLSLFELFDRSRAQAWMHHAAAARSLVKHQGPYPRIDEFEKQLFIAQTGPIITEAILENERCFLEENSWQEIFQSVISDGVFHERSENVILVRMHMAFLPGLLVDVGQAVQQSSVANSAKLNALRARVELIRCKLLDWRHDFDASIAGRCLSDAGQDLLTEVLGTYIVCMIMANRMGICVFPERSVELENHTVVQATGLCNMVSAIAANNPHTYLFMIQKLKVAHVALATTDEWRTADERKRQGDGTETIQPRVFRRWSTLLGRKTP